MVNNKTVLNLVHPYTYKQEGQSYIIGPTEKFQERNAKVSEFVNYALKSDAHVLWHKLFDIPGGQMMREMGFLADPLFQFLFNEKVECFSTTKGGVPIVDKKPNNISAENWKLFKEIFISESDLKKKVIGAENVLFIGGFLECCVSNCMGAFTDNLAIGGEKIFYVPELCVTGDVSYWQTIKPKLEQRKIRSLSYLEAINLF